MADNRIYRTRTLGIPAEGLKDQYADGVAARLWEIYIGDKTQRTQNYRDFIVSLLKENSCVKILDVACGTGIDSIMLIEEGFSLTSIDLSDKMLKYALKKRWNRRNEPAFDAWEIEEADWLTLSDDIQGAETFDAVVCLGNSFAHLPDMTGDQSDHRLAICNFCKMVKPGGILVIDHRNYDYIINKGVSPAQNIYYNSKHIQSIKTSVLMVEGKPSLVTLDYYIDTDALKSLRDETDSDLSKRTRLSSREGLNKFRLSYYPHVLDQFSQLLKECFGCNAVHKVYGDFRPLGEVENPGFYIHVIQKPL